MKFALVVGHTSLDQGATLTPPFQYVSEYEYNTILAALIHRQFINNGQGCEVFFRDNGGIKLAYAMVKAHAPTCVVELHFNAAAAQANGSETLFGDTEGRKLALLVQSQLVKALGRTGLGDRGTKAVQPGARGFENVNNGSGVPMCLAEPFFGSSRDDAELGLSKQTDIAKAIFTAMARYAGVPGI